MIDFYTFLSNLDKSIPNQNGNSIEIKSQDDLKLFFDFFKKSAIIANKYYRKEFIQLLIEQEIFHKHIIMRELVKEKIKEINSYKICEKTSTIQIIKNGLKKSGKLLPIDLFLSSIIKDKTKNIKFFLILGYYCIEENFELVQLYLNKDLL